MNNNHICVTGFFGSEITVLHNVEQVERISLNSIVEPVSNFVKKHFPERTESEVYSFVSYIGSKIRILCEVHTILDLRELEKEYFKNIPESNTHLSIHVFWYTRDPNA